eukprot:3509785-Pyramimonas_sp.AAC.1
MATRRGGGRGLSGEARRATTFAAHIQRETFIFPATIYVASPFHHPCVSRVAPRRASLGLSVVWHSASHLFRRGLLRRS